VTLAVGQPLPAFTARNQHGEQVRLADLSGTPVAVVFYPWAFSRICRGELAALRDSREHLDELGLRVLGVSCDAMFSLRAYADAERIEFDLLSDHWPHGALARAFGVFDERAGCALRGSFLADRQGVISWRQVNAIRDARDLGDLLAAAKGRRT
jgi:peroxiredoxin